MTPLQEGIKQLLDQNAPAAPADAEPAPRNYADLRDAVVKCDFREEHAKLGQCLQDNAENDAALRDAFKVLCTERDAKNAETSLDFFSDANNKCNCLYWQVAKKLFPEAKLQQMLEILTPSVQSVFDIQLRASAFTSGQKRIHATSPMFRQQENLAVLQVSEVEPGDTPATLGRFVRARKTVVDLTQIKNYDFSLHRRLYREFEAHPEISARVYQHNDTLTRLSNDIEHIEKDGLSVESAIIRLRDILKRSGSSYTGATFAPDAAFKASLQFKNYVEALPDTLTAKVRALQSAQGKSIANVLEHLLVNLACVELAASYLTGILDNAANRETLDETPSLTPEKIREMRRQHDSPVHINGNPTIKSVLASLKRFIENSASGSQTYISHATQSAHTALSTYIEALPAAQQAQVLALKSGEGTLSDVLAHLAEGKPLIAAAALLQEILDEADNNSELLENSPDLNIEKASAFNSIFRRYPLNITGSHRTTRLPTALRQQLLSNLKITKTEDFIGLITDLPIEEYATFLSGADIQMSPKLPGQLAKLFDDGWFTPAQIQAFFIAIIDGAELFGGFQAVLVFIESSIGDRDVNALIQTLPTRLQQKVANHFRLVELGKAFSLFVDENDDVSQIQAKLMTYTEPDRLDVLIYSEVLWSNRDNDTIKALLEVLPPSERLTAINTKSTRSGRTLLDSRIVDGYQQILQTLLAMSPDPLAIMSPQTLRRAAQHNTDALFEQLLLLYPEGQREDEIMREDNDGSTLLDYRKLSSKKLQLIATHCPNLPDAIKTKLRIKSHVAEINEAYEQGGHAAVRAAMMSFNNIDHRIDVVLHCRFLNKYSKVYANNHMALARALLEPIPEPFRQDTIKTLITDWDRHDCLYNIAPLMTFFSTAERIALVNEKNLTGLRNLQASASNENAMLFMMLLSIYPADERAAAVNVHSGSGNSIIESASHSSEKLQAILELCPDLSAEDKQKITQKLQVAKLREAFKQGGSTQAKTQLESYPIPERAVILLESNILSDIIKDKKSTAEDMQALLAPLPSPGPIVGIHTQDSDEGSLFLETIKGTRPELTNILLEQLKDNQAARLNVLQQTSIHGNNAFKMAVDDCRHNRYHHLTLQVLFDHCPRGEENKLFDASCLERVLMNQDQESLNVLLGLPQTVIESLFDSQASRTAAGYATAGDLVAVLQAHSREGQIQLLDGTTERENQSFFEMILRRRGFDKAIAILKICHEKDRAGLMSPSIIDLLSGREFTEILALCHPSTRKTLLMMQDHSDHAALRRVIQQGDETDDELVDINTLLTLCPEEDRADVINQPHIDVDDVTFTALQFAARRDKTKYVKAILALCKPAQIIHTINKPDADGQTPVLQAVAHNRPEMIEALLGPCPLVDRPTALRHKDIISCLPIAAIRDNTKVYSTLLKYSTSEMLKCRDSPFYSVLRSIINSRLSDDEKAQRLHSYLTVIKERLTVDERFEVMSAPCGPWGRILLNVIEKKDYAIAEILLDACPEEHRLALVFAEDERGNSVYNHIFQKGDLTAFQLCIKGLGDKWSEAVIRKNRQGQSLLCQVLESPRCDMVSFMDAALDPLKAQQQQVIDIINDGTSKSLINAAIEKRPDAIPALLNYCTSEASRLAAVSKKDPLGWTPLVYAAKSKHADAADTIKLLMQPYTDGKQRIEAVSEALLWSTPENIIALLFRCRPEERAAAISKPNKSGDSPLYKAVRWYPNAQVVKNLLKLCRTEDLLSSMNQRYRYSETLLECALKHAPDDVIQALLAPCCPEDQLTLARTIAKRSPKDKLSRFYSIFPELGLEQLFVDNKTLADNYLKFTGNNNDIKQEIIAVIDNLLKPSGPRALFATRDFSSEAMQLQTKLKALDNPTPAVLCYTLQEAVKKVAWANLARDKPIKIAETSLVKRIAFCHHLAKRQLNPEADLRHVGGPK